MSSEVLWALSMAGTVTCILQNAAGIPMLRQICREGDASQFTRLPLFTMTVVTLQIGLYGLFVYGLPDGLQLLLANAIGLSLWVPSFFVFLAHTRGARAKAALALQYLAALAWGVALPVGLFSSPALSLPSQSSQPLLPALPLPCSLPLAHFALIPPRCCRRSRPRCCQRR